MKSEEDKEKMQNLNIQNKQILKESHEENFEKLSYVKINNPTVTAYKGLTRNVIDS